MLKADVIVIGAGPAGSVASALLGSYGFDVLLVDRAEFPREKVCGDAIAYSCIEPLRDLGVEPILKERTVFETQHLRLLLSDGTSHSVHVRDGEPFVRLIPRIDLDHLLVKAARSFARVCFIGGCSARTIDRVALDEFVVRLEGADVGSASAPLVIVAAGAATNLCARRQEPQVTAMRAYFDDLDSLTDSVEFILHERVLPGYFWIFPLGPRSANIGVASYAPRNSLRDELAWFIQEHPRGRQLRSGRQRGRARGGMIPVTCSSGSRVEDGIILCGDAGRFGDPLTFHGIGPAIWSGVFAAQVAKTTVQEGHREGLFEYDDLWRAKFGVSSLFVGTNLFEGVDPMSTARDTRPIALRSDAAANYESMFRTLSGG